MAQEVFDEEQQLLQKMRSMQLKEFISSKDRNETYTLLTSIMEILQKKTSINSEANQLFQHFQDLRSISQHYSINFFKEHDTWNLIHDNFKSSNTYKNILDLFLNNLQHSSLM